MCVFDFDHLLKHKTTWLGSIKVSSLQDGVRLVSVDHRALRRTHERVASNKVRDATFRNGVLHSLSESSHTQYPADADEQVVPRERGDPLHPQQYDGADLQLRSSSTMQVELIEVLAVSETSQKRSINDFESREQFVRLIFFFLSFFLSFNFFLWFTHTWLSYLWK